MVGNPLLALAGLNRQTETPEAEKKGKTIGERPSYLHRHIQNSVVAAIDIGTFTDVNSYKEHVDSLIDGIKALPRAEGFTEIFVPGELEEKTCQDRSRNGIPLPEGTVHNLQSIAKRFDVKLPAGL
jgi:LDH2 family malate/lactate/ureidoglycolate dehydrogenase